MSLALSLSVNGEACVTEVEPRTHLADFVRDGLLLTGTHLGCEHGVCGACTLMVDGRPVRSCLTLAAGCAGADVRTIEGFEGDSLMAALRRAFTRHHALQCGYCTPGMLVTAYDIVRRFPDASETRIRAELAGNLCRCTGYVGIVAAIVEVAASGLIAAVQPSLRTAVQPLLAISTTVALVDGQARAWTASDLSSATSLSRELALSMSADSAWALLRDIRTVVTCVPGAALTRLAGDEAEGSLTVSVGPMRAKFGGRARITYDDAARTGSLTGGADDKGTRSAAAGAMMFRVVADSAERCAVHAEIRYRLTGPLAQAGRPAIVADVVDRMLERFNANLVATAGGQIADVRPIGGLRMLAGLLMQAVRRLARSSKGA
jgi:carbon-monoxide dehydrogenase small subunit